MSQLHKLRVVTGARLTALAIVRAEVAAAVGEVPKPHLQELDRDEIVIELSLPDGTGVPSSPSDLAKEVNRVSCGLDVLGAWNEQSLPAPTSQLRPDRILEVRHAVAIPAALRAVVDGVPTAQWLTDEHCWRLATHDQGHKVVGVSDHRGYSHRFSASEALAGTLALTA